MNRLFGIFVCLFACPLAFGQVGTSNQLLLGAIGSNSPGLKGIKSTPIPMRMPGPKLDDSKLADDAISAAIASLEAALGKAKAGAPDEKKLKRAIAQMKFMMKPASTEPTQAYVTSELTGKTHKEILAMLGNPARTALIQGGSAWGYNYQVGPNVALVLGIDKGTGKVKAVVFGPYPIR